MCIRDRKKEGDKKDDSDKPADKPADKSDEKKSDEKVADEKKPARQPKPEPRKLTNLGAGFRSGPAWSPDSKFITFTDNVGKLYLTTVESGETKVIDEDPWGNPYGGNWSHDSQWLTFSRAEDNANSNNGIIFLYNIKTGKKTQVTSNMFASGSPVFDRKGDFLFFSSNRIITNPTYSDLDSTFVYHGTQALYMVPLRGDVKNPFAPKSDEEELKKDEPKKDEKTDDKQDEKKDDSKKEDAKKDEPKKDDDKNGDKKEEKKSDEAAKPDDGLSGTWSGQATGNAEGMPPGGVPITMHLTLHEDGSVTGTVSSVMGGGSITSGKYSKSTGELNLTVTLGKAAVVIAGKISGDDFTGTFTVEQANGTVTARRTTKGGPGSGGDGKSGDAKGKDAPAKDVKIDLENFERRAVQLPVPAGSFGGLAVSNDNKLIYARLATRGAGEGSAIKIFDPADEAREEKTVVAGSTNFDISADGKKLLVMKGGSSMSVLDASAGGGKSTNVPTAGMMVSINPPTEWRQILTETWRLHRDFFYEPTMHGVEWTKVRDHYLKMIDDCVSREDVAFVQAEMVSELNIGHAYISAPGDVEAPVAAVNVGLLGCDFELVKSDAGTAYRIAKIYSGADWDADARGPLTQLGLNVKEGEYLLAVNGVPLDTAKDPYAAFLGTADKVTSITVGPVPVLDYMNEKVRDVLVTPINSEGNVRYRAWIEEKRAYADKASDGKIGYIYVPNTGVDGQSDLFRQFTGQRGKAALIIDDRWNGGGQIPTRFIEMLNRKTTNYWARRGGKDWAWPPDAHFGPKAMLINGLAGSGGDMFPWLFKHEKIGKVIGTRTWGGLVGISGNPLLIDGGVITVPTFGFYETDGTWGVEGHGIDPDIEVIDDPAKMVDGGDPQMDVAISTLLDEITKAPYLPPVRPKSPNRSGMGIEPKDK